MTFFAAGLIGTGTQDGKLSYTSPALFLAIIWVVIARRQLTRLQKEYISVEEALGNHKTKQRIILRKRLLTVLVIFLCLLSIGLGSERGQRSQLVQAWKREAAELGSANVNFRARLAQILERETLTWDDYVQQTFEVEALLKDAEPRLARYEQFLHQTQSVFGYDASFSLTLELLRRSAELDRYYIQLIRDESAHAKRLSELPSNKQDAYYANYIQPIQLEKQELSNEVVELLQELQKSGVKLPSDVSDLLVP